MHELDQVLRIAEPRFRAIDLSASCLGVGTEEPVKYRHVRLRCGTHVLSEADNW
jgi:hypothetical protein